MSAEFREGTVRRIDWIIDGYTLGEYDIFECGARIGRAIQAGYLRRPEATDVDR
ncbi:hypothetical protein K3M35_05315 [Rhodococcus sp. DMU2021]|uniref:hypothetical protein n=1 Tax=Rhodococcus sp. DMU2021 TaxID=2866997 RepID=UPI001C7DAD8F|nr:hypothetical protein [Rhodococcus sp. DMU2021]MBX4168086.1 hypothetical protein [Rhodococcus sp. DMU2021]